MNDALDEAVDEAMNYFSKVWDDGSSEFKIGRDIIKIARNHDVSPKELNEILVDAVDCVMSHATMPLPDGRLGEILEGLSRGEIPLELNTQPDEMSCERMYHTLHTAAVKKFSPNSPAVDCLHQWNQ